MEMTSKRVRLSVDISSEMHRDLKYKAVFHNCTISTWIKRAILDRMAYENQFIDGGTPDDLTENIVELRDDIITTNESTPEGVQVP